MASPFEMPQAVPGMPVYFYLGGCKSQEPTLAIVTKLGEGTLALVCFTHDSYSVEPHVGVRHVDDPMLRNADIAREAGGWDYCTSSSHDVNLLHRVAALEKRLAAMEDRLATERPAK